MEDQERKKGHPSTAELGQVRKKVCRTGRETKLGRGVEGRRSPLFGEARGADGCPGRQSNRFHRRRFREGRERQPRGQGTGRWRSPLLWWRRAAEAPYAIRGPLERSQTVLLQRNARGHLAGAQCPSASPRGWQERGGSSVRLAGSSSSRVSRGWGAQMASLDTPPPSVG